MTTKTQAVYTADTAHSNVEFAVKYMKVADFKAPIHGIEAEIDLNEGRLSGRVPIANVQVADENMKGHLLSPEFFDAENHPYLLFESTQVKITGDKITGDGELTIKGITKEITFAGAITEPIVDPYGNDRVGIVLEAVIDRQQFDLKWNTKLPSGEWALADEVAVVVNLQAVAA